MLVRSKISTVHLGNTRVGGVVQYRVGHMIALTDSMMVHNDIRKREYLYNPYMGTTQVQEVEDSTNSTKQIKSLPTLRKRNDRKEIHRRH